MSRKFFAWALFATVLSAVAVVFPVRADAQRRSAYRVERGNLTGKAFEIFNQINDRRRRSRLRQLVWNARAAEMAHRYSEEMARERFFGHYDRRGRSVKDRARNFGLHGWSGIGENLFLCQGCGDISSLAVRGWLNSNSHRKNILNPQWTATGIGIARDRSGKIYITQVFLR
jgi:uncharacterized protein YkwD